MGYFFYYDSKVKNNAAAFNKLDAATKATLQRDNPRKEVTQYKEVYSCRITQLVEMAEEFAKEWKRPLDNILVKHNPVEDYGSHSSEMHLELKGLETDEQYQARLWEINEANRYREDHDRKEFERLSAKFSKK